MKVKAILTFFLLVSYLFEILRKFLIFIYEIQEANAFQDCLFRHSDKFPDVFVGIAYGLKGDPNLQTDCVKSTIELNNAGKRVIAAIAPA